MTEFTYTRTAEIASPAAATSRLKRAVDIVGAVVGLLLIAPMLVLVAILIRLDSRGPILFPQERHGLGATTFRIYKFRTMTAAASREEFRQATVSDSRITRVGHVLRRFSIDELPQLFNVLLGDMSLIGPRPHPVALDQQYAPLVADYMRRYSVRPGMSGLAQVTGHRGPTPSVEAMAARVARDLRYIDEWTMVLDVRILVRTVVPWWSEVRGGS